MPREGESISVESAISCFKALKVAGFHPAVLILRTCLRAINSLLAVPFARRTPRRSPTMPIPLSASAVEFSRVARRNRSISQAGLLMSFGGLMLIVALIGTGFALLGAWPPYA